MSGLTKTVLRLHLTLWRRSMKSNVSAVLMNGLVLFYGVISVVGVLLVVSIALRSDPVDTSAPLLAGAVGMGMLGYAMVAVMLPSGEGQLQPESFAVLPLRGKDLMPGLLLMQILQTRGLLPLVATIATTVVVFLTLPVSIVVAVWIILAMVISFTLTIVVAETIATLMSGAAASGASAKDRRALMTFAGFVILWLGYMITVNSSNADPIGALRKIGLILQWTPFGGPGAMVGYASAGRWGPALAAGVVSLGFVALGLWFWLRSTERRLIAPLDQVANASTTSKATTKGLLLPGLRWGVFGIVYSRALRYFRRDSRMIANLGMLPVMCAYFLFMGYTQDTYAQVVIGIGVAAALCTMGAMNDFGYDGPSTWSNISSGAKVRDMVLARHFASLTPGVLIYLTFLLIANVMFPVMPVRIVSLLGIGGVLATSSINLMLTSFNPFPLAAPGTNPWQDKSGFTGAAFLAAFAGLLGGWIPLAPGIVLTVMGVGRDSGTLIGLGIAVGIAIPLALYLVAIRVATRRVENKYPEIFQKVKAWT